MLRRNERDVPHPDPVGKDLVVAALMGVAIQLADAEAERLLRARQRPEVLRHLFDDPHVKVELLDGSVVVLMP